jgi:hypothetical protein
MSERRDPLRRQLEQSRFERALEIVEGMADRRVQLTTTELARLNSILRGREQWENDDPWRREPVSRVLPSGREVSFSLHADPVLNTREKLHYATEISENGHALQGGCAVYVGLIQSHMFVDANRRTAALAAHYFFTRYQVPMSGRALHEIGVGDLGDPEQVKLFNETVEQIARFSKHRKV